MSRTLLFERVRRLYSRAHASSLSESTQPRPSLSRRELLRGAMGGLGAAIVLPTLPAQARLQPRIAIIGAGMAGLTCAYRLHQAGVSATVYEASRRTGGRMYTARGQYPNHQVFELGGELIDTGHVHLHNLADELGIQLDDRLEQTAELSVQERYVVDGRVVDEEVIQAQFAAVIGRMRELAARADSDDPAYDREVYERLNRTSLERWLERNLGRQPELKAVLANAYRGEYGLDPEQQSALNLLFLITTSDTDDFALFGASDERYHTHLGSQTFPDEIVERLPAHPELDSKLMAVRGSSRRGYWLSLERGGRTHSEYADWVVFALPFTMLREVDLSRVELSPEKRAAIRHVGYGTNAKVMGAFARRVWRDVHDATGSIVTDEPYQQSWDTSIGQAGTTGVLTNFLGGRYGLKSGVGSAESWYRSRFLPGVDRVFPGVREAYLPGTARRMHWPTYPFNKGSYLCYRPGQWDFFGIEGAPEADSTLLFCGEHTSLDNQGYMEGAAETGELVAGAILARLGLPASPRHQWALRFASVVPQAALGEAIARGSYAGRRRARQHALVALLREGARRSGVQTA